MTTEPKNIAVVGAGIFGLSLATALNDLGHKVTVFDLHPYDKSSYAPDFDDNIQAASVDHNKIFRASYGDKIHYQNLAVESRQEWEKINNSLSDEEKREKGPLFNESGMLRVQPDEQLSELEQETLTSMESEGIRDTQFIKSSSEDRNRAHELGWDHKLLEFQILSEALPRNYEAVLDSLAGFIRCSDACDYFYKKASANGVKFIFGPENGAFASLIEEKTSDGRKLAKGLKTKDGASHYADVVAIAAGSFSTQLLPELAYHLESSAGSLAMFKIDKSNTSLWEKYSSEQFPVIIWKSASRSKEGTETGSVYLLPRTHDGLLKIGYRGKKFTNFQPAPDTASFKQNGMWSIPLSPAESLRIEEDARKAIRHFVSIFLPEFRDEEFYKTKMCWYTDSLDNSFLVDYVPSYADNSVFVCTGGSGHGAKFLPVLGKHAADILEHGKQSTSYMRSHWTWRDRSRRGNGLQEGPEGPRNVGKRHP